MSTPSCGADANIGTDDHTDSHPRASSARRALPAAPALLAAASLAICLAAATRSCGADEDIFRYIGYAWSQGDLPYRDAFENKPPAIFLLWAILWRIAGGAPPAGRLLGLLATCATALLLARMAARFWSSPRGVWAGVLFIAAMCARDFDFPFADTETFGVLLVVAALSVVWPGDDKTHIVWRYLLAGLLCGVGITFKPVFALEAAVVAGLAVTAHRDLRTRASLVFVTLAGSMLPLAACLAYFASRGIASDFMDVAFASLGQAGTLPSGHGSAAAGLASHVVVGVTRLAPRLSLPMMLALLAASSTCTNVRDRGTRRPVVLLLTGWFFVALAGIAAQGWAWGHQFKQLLPPLCILAVGALTGNADDQLRGEHTRRHRLAERLLILAMLLSLMGLLHRAVTSVGVIADTAQETAAGGASVVPEYASPEEAVAALTGPDDRIWCYPRSDLYLNTGRLAAARHFTPVFLSVPGAREETLRALGHGRARVVLIDWSRVEAGHIDPAFAVRDRPAFHNALRELLSRAFRVRGRAGPWTIHAFREGGAAEAPP